MNYENSWTRPGNLREVKVQAKVHFSAPTKDGKNIFQVIDRDTKGMRGSQDKFSMVIVDKSSKLIKDLGSGIDDITRLVEGEFKIQSEITK